MTPSPRITVLVADDHALVRQGLCALLKADGHFVVVGEAKNGREAVELAQTKQPDVIVMDIAMPGLNGVAATQQILAANPAAKVLVLSAHSDYAYVERTIAVGAAGFIEKQSVLTILTQGIREITRGHTYFSPSVLKRLRDAQERRRATGMVCQGQGQLTSRESEVLQLVAEGLANKQIAADLGISCKTVEKHRQHLMDKLDIHDTAGLTRHAIAEGVIESWSS